MLRKEEATTRARGGFLAGMPPKTSFVFGVVIGIVLVLVAARLFG